MEPVGWLQLAKGQIRDANTWVCLRLLRNAQACAFTISVLQQHLSYNCYC